MVELATQDARARIEALLERCAAAHGSDVHLTSGEAPRLRVSGDLVAVGADALTAAEVDEVLAAVVPESKRGQLRADEIDFSYTDAKKRRYRVAAFRERRGRAIAFRLLGAAPPELDTLGLPRDILRATYAQGGLVLFAGAAGQGKTTTLASVLQDLCRHRVAHLVTLEDPVEYKLAPGVAYVEQREVGTHVASFESGLHDALQADPDVIAVGELRDLETIRTALDAAETGTLVFGTVHAYDTVRAIGRIVDAFEVEERGAARVALASTLRMVVAQTLLHRTTGGRIPAVEVVYGCTPVATLIRDGKEHELPSVIESNRGRGMRLLDDSLLELVRQGRVTADEARFFAVHKDVFARRIEERAR